MTDRPIIFSAPMVRALLEGRKTQTRRVLKPEIGELDRPFVMDDGSWHVTGPRGDHMSRLDVRYRIGDRLWCRESIRADEHDKEDIIGIRYAADDHFEPLPETDEARDRHFILRCYRSDDPDLDAYKPVPSIHMPRWASRLTLTVTDVRVQRLQEISEADARAEGGANVPRPGDLRQMGWDHGSGWHGMAFSSFRVLWNDLHGPDAWTANPWIVALTFTVSRHNIDAPEAHHHD